VAKPSGDHIPPGRFVFENDLPLISSLPGDERTHQGLHGPARKRSIRCRQVRNRGSVYRDLLFFRLIKLGTWTAFFEPERLFQMTRAELIQVSHGFRKMIEAIPKTRVREHMPAINQISMLLEQLKSEVHETPCRSDVWRGVTSGKD
jgi:hypothetical protein